MISRKIGLDYLVKIRNTIKQPVIRLLGLI